MNLALFWHILEQARTESEGDEECLVALVERQLMALGSADIETFARLFLALHNQPYPDLLQALEERIGFVSDDDFTFFRAWLMSQGKTTFCTVTRQPTLLQQIVHPQGNWQLEDLLYAPERAYRRVGQRDLWEVLREHRASAPLLETYEGPLAPAV